MTFFFQSHGKLKKSTSADCVEKKNDKTKPPSHLKTEIDSIKQKEIEKLTIEKTRKKSEKLAISGKSCQHRVSDGSGHVDSDNDYIDLTACASSHKKIDIEDFNLVKLVGKGSFGKVNFSRHEC